MLIRRLLILLAAVAAAATATTDLAHAGTYPRGPGKKFLLYVKGSQKTTYERPERESYENACNRFTGSSSASETISYHSRSPAKVRVLTSPFLAVSYPSIEEPGVDVAAKITRHSKTIKKVTNKGCGQPASSTVVGGKDCGSRSPGWVASLSGGFGKTALAVNDSVLAPLTPQGYDDCEIPAPDAQGGISPTVGSPTEIEAKISRAKIGRLKPGQRLVLNASKTFSKSLDPGATKNQHVTWQVRLLRVK